LISPEPWSEMSVSKHHYAIHLAGRNNKVFFLNPPTRDSNISNTAYDNVWKINYRGFPKGIRFYPECLRKFLISKVYDRILSLCQVRFDIVWSFDNSVFFDFSALPDNVLKISHIVDLNQNFRLANAASTADICFCTTDFIKVRLHKYNKRVHKINHGLTTRSIYPKDLPGENKIKALYVGNVSSFYFDWKLFYEIV